MAATVRVSIRAREICSQRDAERIMFGPGGSAGGPKPGRDGFNVELAGAHEDRPEPLSMRYQRELRSFASSSATT